MRKTLWALALCVVAAFAFAGCSKGGADEAPMKAPASVDNNAPAAATAGATPAYTDTPLPGGGGKKMGGKTVVQGVGPTAPPPTGGNN